MGAIITQVRPESLQFAAGSPGAVLGHMAAMAQRHRGWINFEPLVDDDRTPVPLCTWSPGEQRRRRVTPPVVGVQHHVGRRVADTVAVPEGWFVVQDHGRRGLVVRVLPDEPHDRVLRWLLDAGAALCPVTITTWAADVFAVVG